MSWLEAALRWYIVLAAMTWAFAPATAWLCRGLPDRGATFARPIAMLAAVYPAWLLGSLGLTPFDGNALIATLIAASAIGWSLVVRRDTSDRRWLRGFAIAEGASLLLFAAYVWLRGYTPQILGTEKPMDIAFLASSTRAVTMPPPDPWFAGEPINYYYLGYLLHGAIARLASVMPEIGFNLALATLFSTTAVAACGAAWNVIRPWLGPRLALGGGLFAAFVVALAGNLYAPSRLLQDPGRTVSAWWWDSVEGIGWRSSRIVCDGLRVDNRCPFPASETINEFPFFSFLLGDLHPHLMALPVTIVAVGLTWNLARRDRDLDSAAARIWLARVAVSGALVGSLYPLNAWDLPTYLLLAAVGVWVGAGATLARAWKPLLLLTAAALAAWLPFLATYVPPTAGSAAALPDAIAKVPVLASVIGAVGPHLGERTSVGEYLTIFGVPYLFAVALVLIGAVDRGDLRFAPRGTSGVGLALQAPPGVAAGDPGDPAEPRSFQRTLLQAAVVTIVPGVLLSAPVIPLCGIPFALAVTQLRASTLIDTRWFALLLFAISWMLSIGVELVYVRDAFDDRMNTLFKFYYQTWTLFGLATALTIAVFWKMTSGRRLPRAMLAAVTVAALLAGAAYPVVASYQWTDRFAHWQGLDGLAYGEEQDADDTAAIRWLARHAAPGDVVLEAAGCSYLPFDRLPFNRVAAFTGVPTVIGWGNNHQRQWRAGQPELIDQIATRQDDVAAMFADPGSPLFDSYGVTWLFVGDYESGAWQAECDTAGPYAIPTQIDGPGSPWQEAFGSGDTRIYRRDTS